VAVYYHVTSSANRHSIAAHGLDWRRMGGSPGLAGSSRHEVEGVFVARDLGEVDFFVAIGETSHPEGLDVWEVAAPKGTATETRDGFLYLTAAVPAERLALVRPAPAVRA
jgi:hypothetical protein